MRYYKLSLSELHNYRFDEQSVLPYNHPMATDRITIFDTTLRDGEQAPGFSLRTSEKVELAKELDALGVDLIEAGFPIASQDDAEGVKQVAASVRRPVIAALARCRQEDIERAGESLKGAA